MNTIPNIPNLLTALRVLLIPIFIVLFYLPTPGNHLWAAAIYGLAAITDWLDGYLARRLKQSTPFGAFLDPVADKLMVTVTLVLLAHQQDNLWLTLCAVIIIGREIVISALREWMAGIGAQAQVAVSWMGKWKTLVQMSALPILILNPPPSSGFWPITGYSLLLIAAVLTLWSMYEYLRAAWPYLSGKQ